MKKKLSPKDKIYQFIANKLLPNRLVWFTIIKAWASYQVATGNNKLPSQVLVVEVLKKLDKNVVE